MEIRIEAAPEVAEAFSSHGHGFIVSTKSSTANNSQFISPSECQCRPISAGGDATSPLARLKRAAVVARFLPTNCQSPPHGAQRRWPLMVTFGRDPNTCHVVVKQPADAGSPQAQVPQQQPLANLMSRMHFGISCWFPPSKYKCTADSANPHVSLAFEVVDFSSVNGTFVNGRKVAPETSCDDGRLVEANNKPTFVELNRYLQQLRNASSADAIPWIPLFDIQLGIGAKVPVGDLIPVEQVRLAFAVSVRFVPPGPTSAMPSVASFLRDVMCDRVPEEMHIKMPSVLTMHSKSEGDMLMTGVDCSIAQMSASRSAALLNGNSSHLQHVTSDAESRMVSRQPTHFTMLASRGDDDDDDDDALQLRTSGVQRQSGAEMWTMGSVTVIGDGGNNTNVKKSPNRLSKVLLVAATSSAPGSPNHRNNKVASPNNSVVTPMPSEAVMAPIRPHHTSHASPKLALALSSASGSMALAKRSKTDDVLCGILRDHGYLEAPEVEAPHDARRDAVPVVADNQSNSTTAGGAAIFASELKAAPHHAVFVVDATLPSTKDSTATNSFVPASVPSALIPFAESEGLLGAGLPNIVVSCSPTPVDPFLQLSLANEVELISQPSVRIMPPNNSANATNAKEVTNRVDGNNNAARVAEGQPPAVIVIDESVPLHPLVDHHDEGPVLLLRRNNNVPHGSSARAPCVVVSSRDSGVATFDCMISSQPIPATPPPPPLAATSAMTNRSAADPKHMPMPTVASLVMESQLPADGMAAFSQASVEDAAPLLSRRKEAPTCEAPPPENSVKANAEEKKKGGRPKRVKDTAETIALFCQELKQQHAISNAAATTGSKEEAKQLAHMLLKGLEMDLAAKNSRAPQPSFSLPQKPFPEVAGDDDGSMLLAAWIERKDDIAAPQSALCNADTNKAPARSVKVILPPDGEDGAAYDGAREQVEAYIMSQVDLSLRDDHEHPAADDGTAAMDCIGGCVIVAGASTIPRHSEKSPAAVNRHHFAQTKDTRTTHRETFRSIFEESSSASLQLVQQVPDKKASSAAHEVPPSSGNSRAPPTTLGQHHHRSQHVPLFVESVGDEEYTGVVNQSAGPLPVPPASQVVQQAPAATLQSASSSFHRIHVTDHSEQPRDDDDFGSCASWSKFMSQQHMPMASQQLLVASQVDLDEVRATDEAEQLEDWICTFPSDGRLAAVEEGAESSPCETFMSQYGVCYQPPKLKVPRAHVAATRSDAAILSQQQPIMKPTEASDGHRPLLPTTTIVKLHFGGNNEVSSSCIKKGRPLTKTDPTLVLPEGSTTEKRVTFGAAEVVSPLMCDPYDGVGGIGDDYGNYDTPQQQPSAGALKTVPPADLRSGKDEANSKQGKETNNHVSKAKYKDAARRARLEQVLDLLPPPPPTSSGRRTDVTRTGVLPSLKHNAPAVADNDNDDVEMFSPDHPLYTLVFSTVDMNPRGATSHLDLEGASAGTLLKGLHQQSSPAATANEGSPVMVFCPLAVRQVLKRHQWSALQFMWKCLMLDDKPNQSQVNDRKRGRDDCTSLVAASSALVAARRTATSDGPSKAPRAAHVVSTTTTTTTTRSSGAKKKPTEETLEATKRRLRQILGEESFTPLSSQQHTQTSQAELNRSADGTFDFLGIFDEQDDALALGKKGQRKKSSGGQARGGATDEGDAGEEAPLQPRGCLLAHAMGLGKSLTTISFFFTLWNYLDMELRAGSAASATSPSMSSAVVRSTGARKGVAPGTAKIPRNMPWVQSLLLQGGAGILITAPKAVLFHWVRELHVWTTQLHEPQVSVYFLSAEGKTDKLTLLQRWREEMAATRDPTVEGGGEMDEATNRRRERTTPRCVLLMPHTLFATIMTAVTETDAPVTSGDGAPKSTIAKKTTTTKAVPPKEKKKKARKLRVANDEDDADGIAHEFDDPIDYPDDEDYENDEGSGDDGEGATTAQRNKKRDESKKALSAMYKSCREILLEHVNCLVVDESHMMRSNSSRLFTAASMFSHSGVMKIALSGSPATSDRQAELLALGQFLLPGLITPSDQRAPTSTTADTNNSLPLLHSVIPRFTHVRGIEVLLKDLPSLVESTLHVKLSDTEIGLYREMVLSQQERSGCVPGKKMMDTLRKAMLITSHTDLVLDWMRRKGVSSMEDVARLRHEWREQQRQAANAKAIKNNPEAPLVASVSWALPCLTLPSLFDPPAETIVADSSLSEAEDDPCLQPLPHNSKMRVALGILHLALTDAHEKVIVFSHSVKALYVLGRLLTATLSLVDGEHFALIDGKMPPAARDSFTNQFNDPNSDMVLLLLTYQTSSLGCSFTGANRVLLLDACEKPTLDAQAICRALRYGQQHASLFVNRLVSDCGVERHRLRRYVTSTKGATEEREEEKTVRSCELLRVNNDATESLGRKRGRGDNDEPRKHGNVAPLLADPVVAGVMEVASDFVSGIHLKPFGNISCFSA